MIPHTFTPAAPARWSDLDTEGRAAAIIALHGQTSDEIAAHLGTTRNAILGLAHRRDIVLDSGRVYARSRFKPHPLPPEETWAPLPESKPTLSAGRKQCLWPVGEADGSHQMFCGSARVRGSYCATHAAMAFAPRRGDVFYSEKLMGSGRSVDPGLSIEEALTAVRPVVSRKEIDE